LNLSALLFNEETLFFSYNKSTAAAAEIEKKKRKTWVVEMHPSQIS